MQSISPQTECKLFIIFKLLTLFFFLFKVSHVMDDAKFETLRILARNI